MEKNRRKETAAGWTQKAGCGAREARHRALCCAILLTWLSAVGNPRTEATPRYAGWGGRQGGVGEGDTRHPVDERRWGDESGLELGGPRAAAQSRDTLKPRSRRPDRGGVCHARYPERNTPCSPTAPRACADCPAGLPGSPGGVARGAELTSVSGPLGRQGRTARGDRLRISAEVGALSPDAT